MISRTNCIICEREVDPNMAVYWLDPKYYPILNGEIGWLCSCKCGTVAYNTLLNQDNKNKI
tara:strand:+ start:283 stop:465 length:183 start_codon:yes stop_codon:yes gene_type:complete